MRSFFRILVCIGFILFSNSRFLSGMEPQIEQSPKIVSSIPSLKALAARPLYRKLCNDFSQEIFHSPNIPQEVKQLICDSDSEMDGTLRQYVASWRGIIDSRTIIINLDVVGVKYSKVSTVCGGDLFIETLWNVRYDIAQLLVNRGMQKQTFVNAMILKWKEYSAHHNVMLINFLAFKVIDITDKFNNWPLMIAAAKNDTHNQQAYCWVGNILDRLLQHGADPNAREDQSGQTPLMLLCKNKGCQSCIRLMIKQGANIEATDDEGKRAIVHAVEAENLQAFKVLMDHNACAGFMIGNESLFDLAKKKISTPEMVRLLRIAKDVRP